MKKVVIFCISAIMLAGAAKPALNSAQKSKIIEYLEVNDFFIQTDSKASLDAGYGLNPYVYSFYLKKNYIDQEAIYIHNYLDTYTGELLVTFVVQKKNDTDEPFPKMDKAVLSFDGKEEIFLRENEEKTKYKVIKTFSGTTSHEFLINNYHWADLPALKKLVNAKTITYTLYFLNPDVKTVKGTITKKHHDDLIKTITALEGVQKIIAE